MRNWYLTILGLTVLGWIAAVPATADPSILVLGDSLSAAHNMAIEDGWVARLGRRLDEAGCEVEMVNAAISGETSAGGLARLPKLLDDHQPAIVMLELGGNDGLRGFPTADLRGNLEAMIRLSREAGAKVMLLGIRIPANYGRRYTEALAGVYPSLAEQYDLPLIPFLLDGIALDPALMQPDGIHPNVAAQPLLVDSVLTKLAPLLSGCLLSHGADVPAAYNAEPDERNTDHEDR